MAWARSLASLVIQRRRLRPRSRKVCATAASGASAAPRSRAGGATRKTKRSWRKQALSACRGRQQGPRCVHPAGRPSPSSARACASGISPASGICRSHCPRAPGSGFSSAFLPSASEAGREEAPAQQRHARFYRRRTACAAWPKGGLCFRQARPLALRRVFRRQGTRRDRRLVLRQCPARPGFADITEMAADAGNLEAQAGRAGENEGDAVGPACQREKIEKLVAIPAVEAATLHAAHPVEYQGGVAPPVQGLYFPFLKGGVIGGAVLRAGRLRPGGPIARAPFPHEAVENQRQPLFLRKP